MDFAKNLVKHENVITRSGIKLLKLPSNNSNNGDDSHDGESSNMESHVNELLINAANKAATNLFLSTGTNIFSTINKTKEKGYGGGNSKASINDDNDEEGSTNTETKCNQSLVNCELYPTQLLPPSSKIVPSSLVVIFESFDCLDFVYVKPGEVFHNKNGHFYHDDFVDKPYGSKIRSRNNQGVGFVYLLKPTPELWQRSLNHRTQIVHELDASLIVFEMNLRPNMVVCESGTGSGALSHSIMRTIAPFGKLHTFEFNHARAKAARDEFKKNGVDHLVEVHWRDVCGKPKSYDEGKSGIQTNNYDGQDETIGVGGFVIGAAKADAIFLDLPEPWLAIPHAAHTIKPYGAICSYSPCVEQSQATIQEMKKYGFHTIKTIEVRLREYYVDEVSIEKAPTMKLPREPVIPYIPGAPIEASSDDKQSPNNTEDENGEDGKNDTQSEKKTNEDGDGKCSKRNSSSEDDIQSKKRKMHCARPFGTIKGHTAFLTFAHASNKSYPDPNQNSKLN